MAQTQAAQIAAYQIQYRQEWIRGFEQMQSLLRDAVTTEAVIKGNQARFLVADSGDSTTVTRGANGLIPARIDDLTLSTATLTEEHDLVKKTRFNIFASQADQRSIMQATSMGVINRKMDRQILEALDGASNNDGSAAALTLDRVVSAVRDLGNNSVPYDGNIWGVISPSGLRDLLKVESFASADYVTKKPLDTASAQQRMQGYYEWAGVKWIVHPNVTGGASADENCFVFHKTALGHACDVSNIDSAVGYDDEQDYSYCRSSVFCGAVLMQDDGVLMMKTIGNA